MKLSLQQKEQFFHEMRELLQSGRTVDQALELKANGRAGALRRVAAGMRAGGAGGTAEGYFAVMPEVFSIMDREIVRGGEMGGRLDDAMGYLSDYYGVMARTRREILTHLAYPVFLLHFGALMLAVPALVQDGAGAFFAQIAWLLGVFYVAAALGWLAFVIAVREARVNPAADRLLQSLPVLGRARVALVSARFCLLMGILVKASGSILSAFNRAAAASGSALFQRGAEQAVLAVQGGDGLGAAVMRTQAFPEAIDRAFQVGEASGRLDQEMERQAERFAEQFRGRLSILANWLPKLVFLGIGLVLAWKIIGYYTAQFQAINSLGL
jgi:type II secretory pathway component PulF